MTITWLGEACFKIEVKSANEDVTILTYPFDPDKTGLKLPRTIIADIVLQQGESLRVPVTTKSGGKPLILGIAGEYEARGIPVYAIPLKREENTSPHHIFRFEAEGIVVTHPGLLNYVPSEEELQAIEGLDVLFSPVGGNGVLDAKKASELVSELEPRIVIPMLYKLPGLSTKREGAESFLKSLGTKPEELPKFKLARKDLPADEMEVVVLAPS